MIEIALAVLGMMSTLNLFILAGIFKRLERIEGFFMEQGWEAIGRPERRGHR